MATEIMPQTPPVVTLPGDLSALIEHTGERTAWRFVEFFTATTRNANTREVYARAVARFLAWFEDEGIDDLQGTIEKAQAIAAHESPRTTKLYDRTEDAISLDEIERIQI